jgi:hypothetical protein
MLQKLQKNDLILEDIRHFHSESNLAGIPRNGLLLVSDELLSYVLSLLREEQPLLPQAAVDEWSELLSHLQCHWVIPLLYWKIGHLSPELHPPEVICTRMREVFLASHARYLTMERQLREVMDAFNRKRIDILLIKGPALALSVYPDPATRPFADIDLLVRSDQYLKARSILNQLSYRSQLDRFETFQGLYSAEPFAHSADATKYFEVDVHWSLFQYHGLTRNNGVEEVLWNTQKVETPTLRFETLDKVNALIYAAFHLILHHPEGMRLTWIGDIALLSQSLVYPDEWEVLRQRCSALKLSLAMQEALKLAQIWYGLKIPEKYSDLTKWLSPEDAEKIELAYVRREKGPDIRLRGYFDNFLSAPRKIQFLLKFLFPSPEYICMTYPPSKKWLLPLSYIRRWGSWIAKVFQYAFHTLALKD